MIALEIVNEYPPGRTDCLSRDQSTLSNSSMSAFEGLKECVGGVNGTFQRVNQIAFGVIPRSRMVQMEQEHASRFGV